MYICWIFIPHIFSIINKSLLKLIILDCIFILITDEKSCPFSYTFPQVLYYILNCSCHTAKLSPFLCPILNINTLLSFQLYYYLLFFRSPRLYIPATHIYTLSLHNCFSLLSLPHQGHCHVFNLASDSRTVSNRFNLSRLLGYFGCLMEQMPP